jgi:hypothetical protein
VFCVQRQKWVNIIIKTELEAIHSFILRRWRLNFIIIFHIYFCDKIWGPFKKRTSHEFFFCAFIQHSCEYTLVFLLSWESISNFLSCCLVAQHWTVDSRATHRPRVSESERENELRRWVLVMFCVQIDMLSDMISMG